MAVVGSFNPGQAQKTIGESIFGSKMEQVYTIIYNYVDLKWIKMEQLCDSHGKNGTTPAANSALEGFPWDHPSMKKVKIQLASSRVAAECLNKNPMPKEKANVAVDFA